LNGDGSKSRMRESTEGGVRSLLDVAIKHKINSKMDDQIDKRIVVMRARLKKKEANEAAMKAVEDAKKANKNKPVQVQNTDGRKVNIDEKSVYTFDDNGRILPVVAPNLQKLPKLDGDTIRIDSITEIKEPIW